MNARDHATLVAALDANAQLDPERVALVMLGESGAREVMTADALRLASLARQAQLAELGVGAGDVVLLVLPQSTPLIALFFGAMRLGAVPSIIAYPSEKMAPALYANRIRSIAASAGARVVVASPAWAEQIGTLVEAADWRVANVEELSTPARPSGPAVVGPDDVAFLQYTSGTTAMPKGIAHSHRRVLAYIEAKAHHHRFRADDVVVSWLPLYHDMGLVSSLLTPIVVGLPTVLMSPFHWVRDPKILLRAVDEFRGTFVWMPNFALSHCARAIRDADLRGVDLGSVRTLCLGGEPVRHHSMRVFCERFGAFGFREEALLSGYGMAENVEGATMTPEDEPPRVDIVDARQLHELGRAVPVNPGTHGAVTMASSGFPMRGTEIRILGEGDRPLPERQVGEIAVRSSYMLRGYYRRPDLDRATFVDDWFRSGDLGYVAEGQLYVCGRKSDVIIVGGRNVYPEDLEALVGEVDGLQPGRAVAFGVDDETLGTQRAILACETSAAMDDDQRLAIQRELRRRAVQELDVVLADVHVVGKGWVIKTSNGKLARAANRERYLEDLGATPAA